MPSFSRQPQMWRPSHVLVVADVHLDAADPGGDASGDEHIAHADMVKSSLMKVHTEHARGNGAIRPGALATRGFLGTRLGSEICMQEKGYR